MTKNEVMEYSNMSYECRIVFGQSFNKEILKGLCKIVYLCHLEREPLLTEDTL